MRALRRLPIETRRQALVLLALFAVLAVVGATRLRGQTTSMCGNGVINAPEECDESTRNGTGPNCTKNCTKVRCGDGIVTRSVGEECDTGTGSTAVSCGRVCTRPECDENDENCSGGCRWTIVACASSSASSAAPASAAASVSSAAPSSSAQASSVAVASSKPSSSAAPAAVSSAVAAPSSAAAPSSPAPSSVPVQAVSSAQSRSAVAAVSSQAPAISSAVSSVTVPAASSSTGPRPPFVPVCGDGWIHPGEQCDDGNRLGFDGCSPTCAIADNRTPRCGDGQLQAPEACDAGARNSNLEPDACRTNCRRAFCGDGVRDEGEACDDGNAYELDGCTWKCEVSVCGNGLIEPMEECDVGSQNSDEKPNVCRSVCRKPWCGDGVTDVGEECDDANRDEEDGCASSCILECPEGSSKIQGRCLILKAAAEECGVLCRIGGAWDAAMDWLFGLFS